MIGQRLTPSDMRHRLLLVLLLSGGCTTTVVPPAHPKNPVTVYLTDYGRHSSILLPVPSGGYDEFAFGDWDFFALGDTQWRSAIRAIFNSHQSTLGRRHLQIDSNSSNIIDIVKCDRVMQFQASKDEIEELILNLNARFRRRYTALIYSSHSELYHVPDTEHYWLLHNCNHVTAEWLSQLGCQIHGPAFLSNFVVSSTNILIPTPSTASGKSK